ncbi:unnamed protein product [Rotaria magnacalcarata]|nr:unnamed protein product [Rotaria magnacalcarata]CAF1643766.1 unnamed protein product [Rotaria magnacalcarata]CAF2066522.1 unnamed protein product [Rotaria magnacalcarata]CAF2103141.1 unnamed protein product [Rotaria magnacalcarata]CAF3846261.1 unnamed protein product [Rotaria magnacalcarata]
MDRPQIPIVLGVSFYTLLYLHYKYDLIARWKGEPIYNDYSYIKQAAERERATRLAALSSFPTSETSLSSSSTGAN